MNVLEINGKIESIYIYFRLGVRIKETKKLYIDGIGRLLLYMGIDGRPNALQLVDPLDGPTIPW